jgi:hypothetical protein
MKLRIAITALVSFFSFTMAAQAGFYRPTTLTLTIPAGKVLINATSEKALNDQFAEIQYKGKMVVSVAMDSNQAGYCADLADTAQMHHQGFKLKGSGFARDGKMVFNQVTGCELQ